MIGGFGVGDDLRGMMMVLMFCLIFVLLFFWVRVVVLFICSVGVQGVSCPSSSMIGDDWWFRSWG